MDAEIRKRVLEIAEIFLNEKTTVRDIGKKVGYSKSTVHKDLTERLKKIDLGKYTKAQEILCYNKSIRHLRGGEATKELYKNKRGAV